MGLLEKANRNMSCRGVKFIFRLTVQEFVHKSLHRLEPDSAKAILHRPLNVIISRGTKVFPLSRCLSSSRDEHGGVRACSQEDDELGIPLTLYWDKKFGGFQEKKALLTIYASKPDTLVTETEINLADFVVMMNGSYRENKTYALRPYCSLAPVASKAGRVKLAKQAPVDPTHVHITFGVTVETIGSNGRLDEAPVWIDGDDNAQDDEALSNMLTMLEMRNMNSFVGDGGEGDGDENRRDGGGDTNAPRRQDSTNNLATPSLADVQQRRRTNNPKMAATRSNTKQPRTFNPPSIDSELSSRLSLPKHGLHRGGTTAASDRDGAQRERLEKEAGVVLQVGDRGELVMEKHMTTWGGGVDQLESIKDKQELINRQWDEVRQD